MAVEQHRCRNCGCVRLRRPFKRRDCCGKCFYLFQYMRVVEHWDLARPETLRQLGVMVGRAKGASLPSLDAMSAEDFAVFKASYLEQIKAALDLLRIREAKRRGERHDIVRRVQQGGRVSLLGRVVRVSKRLRGKDVAFRPTGRDGMFDVLLGEEIIAAVDVHAVGRDGGSIPPLADKVFALRVA